jgi:hypothetical protein
MAPTTTAPTPASTSASTPAPTPASTSASTPAPTPVVFYLKDNSSSSINIDTSKTYRLVNMQNKEEIGCLYSKADKQINIYPCIDL